MSSTLNALSASSAASSTLIAARWYDYIPIAIYFAFVIGVGLIARAKAATADGFLTSGRSLPAWVTGIAFVSANLGAVEIMGMSANGAEYGMPTFHYFWIGAIPAMLFLGAMTAHMLRIFFTGAFRRPREANWIIGCVLLLLGMAEGFDVGLEMSGHPSALPEMVQTMNHGGRIALLGLPSAPIDWTNRWFWVWSFHVSQ